MISSTMNKREGTILCFLIDVTGSMQKWIDSLVESLPSLLRSMALTRIFDEICILSYTDYDQPINEIVKFSGFCSTKNISEIEKLQKFAKSLEAGGGGRMPEAFKTAMLEIAKFKTDNLFVLHLTDAPPHTVCADIDEEGRKEQKNLGENFDITSIIRELEKSHDYLNYSCLTTCSDVLYCHLAQIFNGDVYPLEGAVTTNNIRGQIARFFNVLFGLETLRTKKSCIKVNHKIRREIDLKSVTVHTIEHIPSANEKLSNSLLMCIKKLRSEPEFLDHAFGEFQKIISETPMALTISPIIGRMWRELCKFRSEPRRNELTSLLDVKKNSLNNSDRTVLLNWLKESYDASAEITEDLEDFVKANSIEGLLRFTPEKNFHAHQIANLLASNDKVEIRKILSRFIIDVNYRGSVIPERSIPMNLPIAKFWELLMHTVAPGTKLSTRYCGMLARHVIECGGVLREQASEFLKTVKGKWINWKVEKGIAVVPETFAYSFVELVKNEDCLTPEEFEFAKFLLKVSHVLRFFRQNEVKVKTADVKSTDGSFPVNEQICPDCKLIRPLTLFTKDGNCGDCFYFKTVQGKDKKFVNGQARTDIEYIDVRCSSCDSIYSRDKKANIIGNSKCFSCRYENRPSPFTTCNKCHNKFVQYLGDKLPNGTCGACAAGLPPRVLQFKEFPVPLKEVFGGLFPDLCSSIGLTFDENFKVGAPLYEAISHFKETAEAQIEPPSGIQYRETRICNVPELWQYAQKIMKNEISSVMPECSVCLEQFPPNKLFPSCGRCDCHQRVCENCNKSWYGKNTPGKILYQRATLCQFCARTPVFRVVDRIQRPLANLVDSIKREPLNIDRYYAWCSRCFKPSEIGNHDCLHDEPHVENYECQSCKNSAETIPDNKECPNCGFFTEKSGGCNHMECVCGAHWCFECGSGFESSKETYDHMWEVHGKIF